MLEMLSKLMRDALKQTAQEALLESGRPRCGIRDCRGFAPTQQARCRMCRRAVCMAHGYIALQADIKQPAVIVCASCIIDEHSDLLETEDL